MWFHTFEHCRQDGKRMKMDEKLHLVLLIIAVAVVNFASASGDYCNIKSCDGQPHTACKFPNSGASSKCGKVLGRGLKEVEKTKIVNLHNIMRQKVARGNEKRGSPGPQPAAENMPQLTWDNELAVVAQRWADQCTWEHDTCRDVNRFKVGQNLAYIGTTGDVNDINILSNVRNWYNEVKDFDREEAKCFKNGNGKGEKIGHYTQLVWGNSTRIGCGCTKYCEGEFNRLYLVCNYAPAGNFMEEPLYKCKQ